MSNISSFAQWSPAHTRREEQKKGNQYCHCRHTQLCLRTYALVGSQDSATVIGQIYLGPLSQYLWCIQVPPFHIKGVGVGCSNRLGIWLFVEILQNTISLL